MKNYGRTRKRTWLLGILVILSQIVLWKWVFIRYNDSSSRLPWSRNIHQQPYHELQRTSRSSSSVVDLVIHLVPHSHLDPGWLETFDEYYNHSGKSILTSNFLTLFCTPLTETTLHLPTFHFADYAYLYFFLEYEGNKPAIHLSDTDNVSQIHRQIREQCGTSLLDDESVNKVYERIQQTRNYPAFIPDGPVENDSYLRTTDTFLTVTWYTLFTDILLKKQLELVGMTYVQPDEALTSPDLYSYQLEYSQKLLVRFLGPICTYQLRKSPHNPCTYDDIFTLFPSLGIAFQNDAFGHSSLTPSILHYYNYSSWILNRIPYKEKQGRKQITYSFGQQYLRHLETTVTDASLSKPSSSDRTNNNRYHSILHQYPSVLRYATLRDRSNYYTNHCPMEFPWYITKSIDNERSSKTSIWSHILYDHYNYPDVRLRDMDQCIDNDTDNDSLITLWLNLLIENGQRISQAYCSGYKHRVSSVTASSIKHQRIYPGNALILLGDDFTFDTLDKSRCFYRNLYRIIERHTTQRKRSMKERTDYPYMNVELSVSTLTRYIDQSQKQYYRIQQAFTEAINQYYGEPGTDAEGLWTKSVRAVALPSIPQVIPSSSDFYVYQDKPLSNAWSGYYSSYPGFKQLLTYSSNILHQSSISTERNDNDYTHDCYRKAVVSLYPSSTDTKPSGGIEGLYMGLHHDALPGTSKTYVMNDFALRSLRPLRKYLHCIRQSVQTKYYGNDGVRLRSALVLPHHNISSFDSTILAVPWKYTIQLSLVPNTDTNELEGSSRLFLHFPSTVGEQSVSVNDLILQINLYYLPDTLPERDNPWLLHPLSRFDLVTEDKIPTKEPTQLTLTILKDQLYDYRVRVLTVHIASMDMVDPLATRLSVSIPLSVGNNDNENIFRTLPLLLTTSASFRYPIRIYPHPVSSSSSSSILQDVARLTLLPKDVGIITHLSTLFPLPISIDGNDGSLLIGTRLFQLRRYLSSPDYGWSSGAYLFRTPVLALSILYGLQGLGYFVGCTFVNLWLIRYRIPCLVLSPLHSYRNFLYVVLLVLTFGYGTVFFSSLWTDSQTYPDWLVQVLLSKDASLLSINTGIISGVVITVLMSILFPVSRTMETKFAIAKRTTVVPSFPILLRICTLSMGIWLAFVTGCLMVGINNPSIFGRSLAPQRIHVSVYRSSLDVTPQSPIGQIHVSYDFEHIPRTLFPDDHELSKYIKSTLGLWRYYCSNQQFIDTVYTTHHQWRIEHERMIKKNAYGLEFSVRLSYPSLKTIANPETYLSSLSLEEVQRLLQLDIETSVSTPLNTETVLRMHGLWNTGENNERTTTKDTVTLPIDTSYRYTDTLSYAQIAGDRTLVDVTGTLLSTITSFLYTLIHRSSAFFVPISSSTSSPTWCNHPGYFTTKDSTVFMFNSSVRQYNPSVESAFSVYPLTSSTFPCIRTRNDDDTVIPLGPVFHTAVPLSNLVLPPVPVYRWRSQDKIVGPLSPSPIMDIFLQRNMVADDEKGLGMGVYDTSRIHHSFQLKDLWYKQVNEPKSVGMKDGTSVLYRSQSLFQQQFTRGHVWVVEDKERE